ncbi:MAG: NAD(P)/FAD-dependent oxidoreductase [Fervidicoccaceae archaeon]
MKVGIIGGGISGILSAIKLLKAGCDVFLYEEHQSIGYPKHCTGLISERTQKELEYAGKKCTDSFYSSINFEIPFEGRLKLFSKYKIVHLDRACLERELFHLFEDLGGKAFLGKKATLDGRNHIIAGGHSAYFDHVIVAEGIRREISKKFLKYLKNEQKVFGLNVVYRAKHELEGITVGFHPSIAKGFFYWIFPTAENTVIVGAGTSNPRNLNNSISLLTKVYNLNTPIEIERYGGWISTGPPPKRQEIRDITFIGDAFGMQKPITGGGIFPITYALKGVEEKSCVSSIEVLRENSIKITNLLKKQLPIAKIAHSESFYTLARKIIGTFNGLEIVDEQGLFDYDRHETIFPYILLHFFDFLREIKIK